VPPVVAMNNLASRLQLRTYHDTGVVVSVDKEFVW
jgi:hypothetical protein